jgi:pimeloyl-ACP methyl ester carboxylesterase
VFLAALSLVALLDSSVVRDIQVAPLEILRTTSTGSGQPVVFLPGIFGGAFSFRHVIAELVPLGYRCIVVEPLAFGSSSHPPKVDYSFAAQADRIGAALDSLGASGVLIVGQSTGAAIAFRIAYRRPALVRGVLSIDGGPAETAATPGLKHALRFGSFLTKLFVGPGTIRKRVWHDLIENSGDTTWVTSAVVDEYTAGQAADVDGTIDALRAMSKSKEPESLRDRIHETRVPVRLLLGTIGHPSRITPEEIEVLRSSLHDFAIESVTGSGQYIEEEQPREVVAAISRLSATTAPAEPAPPMTATAP